MLAKYVSIFLWCFLAGVVVASTGVIAIAVFIALTLAGLIGLGLSSLRNHVRSASFLNWTAAACLGLSLGNLVWSYDTQSNEFEALIGTEVYTEGVITAWPGRTASGNQALLIRPDGFKQALRASLRRPLVARPGDRVWIRGRIQRPENFSKFNYVAYLKKNNVYAELGKAQVVVIEARPSRFTSLLGDLRKWIVSTAFARLNGNSASLALGTLIGYSDELPKTMSEAFQKSGLTHILVASGFNLTVIASSVGALGWVLGRRASDLTSLSAVWFFVLLTGSSGSVVRAGVMASLVLSGRACGRMPSSYHTLLLAVAVMVMLNPLQLFYDIGFQLSVGATIGVLEANRLRVHLQRQGWLAELLWPTMGAIIVTSPIVSFYFGTFSLIAPVANLFILPFVPFVMLFGALSLIPYVHILSAPITELIVGYQIKVTVLLAGWDYSSISAEASFALVVGYYVILWLMRESFYSRVGRLRAKKEQLKDSSVSDKMTKIII